MVPPGRSLTLARAARVAASMLAAALILTQGLALAPGTAPAAAAPSARVSGQSSDVAIPGGRFYPQAGGFAVTNQRGMPFYSAFLRLGGVAVLGYPVSRRFYLDSFTCQAMQGGLLQYLPDTADVVLANTFELLSRYGYDDWLYDRGIPRPATDDAGSFEEAVQIRLSWLTDAAIAQRYLAPPPGWTGQWTVQDAINRYGLPMSRPESFGPFISQRFQRVAFQDWQQAVPGMPPPGTVSTVLGGQLVVESGLLGPLATLPEPGLEFPVPVDLTVAQRVPPSSTRRSGAFAFTVTSSATGKAFPAAPAQAVLPTASGTYLVALASVSNTSTQAATPSLSLFRLIDRTGTVYQPDTNLSATAAAALGTTAPGTPIAPGQAASLALAFSVPDESGPWQLAAAGAGGGAGGAEAATIELSEPPPGTAAETTATSTSGGTEVIEVPGTAGGAGAGASGTLPPPPSAGALVILPTPTPRTVERVLPGVLFLRVLDVVRPYAAGTPPPPGMEFIAVRIAYENRSGGQLPYGPETLYVSARGNLVRGRGTGDVDSLPSGVLGPGETAQGTVLFTVPFGSVVTGVVYSAGNSRLEIPLP